MGGQVVALARRSVQIFAVAVILVPGLFSDLESRRVDVLCFDEQREAVLGGEGDVAPLNADNFRLDGLADLRLNKTDLVADSVVEIGRIVLDQCSAAVENLDFGYLSDDSLELVGPLVFLLVELPQHAFLELAELGRMQQ